MFFSTDIGPCTLSKRTQYSKFQVYDENNANISDTKIGQKIIEDYILQESNPDRYFDISEDELLMFKDNYGYYLNYLFIPEYITSIERSAFSENNFVYIHFPKDIGYVGDEAFKHCHKLKEVYFPPSFSGIIEWSVFRSCVNLEKVALPEKLDVLPKFLFNECFSLKDIVLPDGMIVIGEYSFNKCESLQTITLPDTIKEIEDYAFNGCKSLTTINIPKSFEKLGARVFAGSNLSTLIFNHDLPTHEPICYGDFFMYCDIKKIVIDRNVSFIDPLFFERIKSTVKEIEYNGSKEEFAKFKRNNKKLLNKLNHAKVTIKNLNTLNEEKTGYIEKIKNTVFQR